LHLRGFFLGDGYPSKEADTYQQPLGAIKLLRGRGFRTMAIIMKLQEIRFPVHVLKEKSPDCKPLRL
jgi:hypothetical protein